MTSLYTPLRTGAYDRTSRPARFLLPGIITIDTKERRQHEDRQMTRRSAGIQRRVLYSALHSYGSWWLALSAPTQ